MSKKSRKRNRKILKALAVGLGAAALMRGRNKGAVSTEGQTPPIGGTDHIPSVNKNWVTKRTSSVPFQNRMTGHGSQVNDGISRAERSQNLARTNPNVANVDKFGNVTYKNARNTAIGSPLIDNPYSIRNVGAGRYGINRKDGGRASHKSGGRVGVGKAKRGFGRALKKGK